MARLCGIVIVEFAGELRRMNDVLLLPEYADW
jgi:hypothetical protein